MSRHIYVMRFRPLLAASLVFSTLAIMVAVEAQNAKKPAPANAVKPVDDKGDGKVLVHGESAITNDATGISQLNKNVTVTQVGEDFILYAQKLTYNDIKQQAVATTNLRVETRDSTIRGERIFADFNTKTLTMTGNVTISTHGSSDGITGNRREGSARNQFSQKASKITCDKVVWDYETHQGTITGSIQMTQGKSEGTCLLIQYDEGQNIAVLTGKVRFKDEKGHVFNTPSYTIYIDEDSSVSGQATLEIPLNRTPGATPRATKAPVPIRKAPRISDEDVKAFDEKPAPARPKTEPTKTEPVDTNPAPDSPAETPVITPN